MSGIRHRVLATLCICLLPTFALPETGVALQAGGTVDVRTGPVAWDQGDSGDPLINAAVGGSYRLPRLWGQPELLGRFGISSAPAQRTGLGWDIGARLHTSGSTAGAWLGAAIGTAGTGNFQYGLTRIEGGVRRSLGRARINVWVSRTGFGGRVVSGGDLNQQDSLGSPDTLARKGVTEYTDLGSQLALSLNRYELGLALTRRIGSAGTRRSAWELSATWWATPSIGVVGAAGHSLAQIGYTVPGGRYTTVGLRLAVGSRPATRPAPDNRVGVERSDGPSLVLDGRRLTVRSAGARSAEVMGDFTDWKPQRLIAQGPGRWTLSTALTPGVHHLNVRFDGGAWLVPSGISSVDDGFGGRVGLVVVR